MKEDLIDLLRRHRLERHTNTPVDVLAHVMVTALQQFEAALIMRSSHDFYARHGVDNGTQRRQSSPSWPYGKTGSINQPEAGECVPGTVCADPGERDIHCDSRDLVGRDSPSFAVCDD